MVTNSYCYRMDWLEVLFLKYSMPFEAITWIFKWKYKPGFKVHPIYHSWNNMKRRCIYPKHINYKDYWWRWITYTERREKFENFYEDMKDDWSKWLSLDRIDVNWNYSKENCRWSTMKVQQRNKNNNVVYKWKCKSEWAEYLWVSISVFKYYVKHHWWEVAFEKAKEYVKKRQLV